MPLDDVTANARIVTDELQRRWLEYPDGRRVAFFDIVRPEPRRRVPDSYQRRARESAFNEAELRALDESLFKLDD